MVGMKSKKTEMLRILSMLWTKTKLLNIMRKLKEMWRKTSLGGSMNMKGESKKLKMEEFKSSKLIPSKMRMETS